MGSQVTFSPSEDLIITSADGSTIRSRGTCALMVRLNEFSNFIPYDFVVIDDLAENLILGEDFLRTYGATIDLDNNTLKLKRQHYDSFDPTPRIPRKTSGGATEENSESIWPAEKNSAVEILHAIESIMIKARSVSRVRIRTVISKSHDNFTVEPAVALLLKKSVMFPASLVSLRMVNPPCFSKTTPAKTSQFRKECTSHPATKSKPRDRIRTDGDMQ